MLRAKTMLTNNEPGAGRLRDATLVGADDARWVLGSALASVPSELDEIFAPARDRLGALPRRTHQVRSIGSLRHAPGQIRPLPTVAVVVGLACLIAGGVEIALGPMLRQGQAGEAPSPVPALNASFPRAGRTSSEAPTIGKTNEPPPTVARPTAVLRDPRKVISRPVRAPSACADGEDARCAYGAILAADSQLRRAYADAVRSGVSGEVLSDVRDRWEDIQDDARHRPQRALRDYADLRNNLTGARQNLGRVHE
jgi:hypothetical protein